MPEQGIKSVSVPEEVQQRIKKYAVHRNLTMGYIVTEAFNEYELAHGGNATSGKSLIPGEREKEYSQLTAYEAQVTAQLLQIIRRQPTLGSAIAALLDAISQQQFMTGETNKQKAGRVVVDSDQGNTDPQAQFERARAGFQKSLESVLKHGSGTEENAPAPQGDGADLQHGEEHDIRRTAKRRVNHGR